MNETSSHEMRTIIESIAGIIAEDIDSLYALDFEKVRTRASMRNLI